MNLPPQKTEDRYSRQTMFAPIGTVGQQMLRQSQVTLIGCGALGSAQAEMIVRAGVGRLRVIDRDFVEISNLQRQMLFDESDVAQNLPKAEAAARKLRLINSQVNIEPIIADANPDTIEQFTAGSHLILDGTDNLITRYLINDVAIKTETPWVYGACIAARGLIMPVLPTGRPCLRCVFDSPPEPGQTETCETAGIIGPIVNITAAYQITEALKILTNNLATLNRNLIEIKPWDNTTHIIDTKALTDGCPCCRDHQFQFLSGQGSLSTVSLCGRNAVQVRPRKQKTKIDLNQLAQRLTPTVPVTLNQFLLRIQLPQHQITVFPDARAIIKGTNNIDQARSLYAQYIGH
ncbi:MAG: ThiF family adenylyltransferase [Sedimentisphaerales bacterium]|nr:ThiF family adenylyltransferase [Sedimentisphaerales bacterium]